MHKHIVGILFHKSRNSKRTSRTTYGISYMSIQIPSKALSGPGSDQCHSPRHVWWPCTLVCSSKSWDQRYTGRLRVDHSIFHPLSTLSTSIFVPQLHSSQLSKTGLRLMCTSRPPAPSH